MIEVAEKDGNTEKSRVYAIQQERLPGWQRHLSAFTVATWVVLFGHVSVGAAQEVLTRWL